MRRLVISALLTAVLATAMVAPAVADSRGHRGGCEEFGQINRLIGQDPASFGLPEARNLGDIVSAFAKADDGTPGVGDIVKSIDHAACG